MTEEINNDSVAEFGTDPNMYAVAVDVNTPSTWKYPIHDGDQITQSISRLNYPSYNDPVLLPEQREEAYKRIENRISQLNIEEKAKKYLLDELNWGKKYYSGVTELDENQGEEIVEYTVSENKKDLKVEIAPGVNYDALIKDDPDPQFLTLEIAKVGKVSDNKLSYNDYLVTEIERQIKTKRPGGNFGHIKDDESDSAMPIPDAFWVGAQRIGKTLYGKAYIMPGRAAEYVRKLDAVGGTIATSIYGRGKAIKNANNVRELEDFNLWKLDFGLPEQVSLKINPKMVITKEFEEPQTKENKKMENTLDITALRPEDAVKLPQAVKDAVLAEYNSANEENTKISELSFELDQAKRTIKEYETELAEFKGKEFGDTLNAKIAETLDWKTSDADSIKALNALRSTLRKNVIAKLEGSLDVKKIDRYITECVQDDEFNILAETVKERLTGPAAVVGGSPKTQDWRTKFVEKSAEIAERNGVINKGAK